jgi:hypothetical protein
MKDSYDFSSARQGPVVACTGKTRITMMLDDDVLEAFRAAAAREGKGYQTLINEALRRTLKHEGLVVTEASLRRILREELDGLVTRQGGDTPAARA